MAPVGISPDIVYTTVGPFLIGTWISTWLYGMMLIQAREYYRTATNDPRWIKYMVAFLLVAETLNSVFDIYIAYHFSVLEFGNAEGIFTSFWAVNAHPAMSATISSIVQSFFGWRVKKLTGRSWLASIIIVLSIIQFLAGVGSSIGTVVVPNMAQFHKFKSVVIVWLGLAPLDDLLIAGSLTWYLRSHKTGFSSTDDITSRITRMTMQNAAITVIWTTFNLAFFLAYTNNLYVIFKFPLTKLYSNCLISSLNARRWWQSPGQGFTYPSLEDGQKPTPAGIHVTTMTEVLQETHELQISSINCTGPPLQIPRQQASVRAKGVATPTRTTHGDGLSMISDLTGYGDGSSREDK